jgi:hypothetical protein
LTRGRGTSQVGDKTWPCPHAPVLVTVVNDGLGSCSSRSSPPKNSHRRFALPRYLVLCILFHFTTDAYLRPVFLSTGIMILLCPLFYILYISYLCYLVTELVCCSQRPLPRAV